MNLNHYSDAAKALHWVHESDDSESDDDSEDEVDTGAMMQQMFANNFSSLNSRGANVPVDIERRELDRLQSIRDRQDEAFAAACRSTFTLDVHLQNIQPRTTRRITVQGNLCLQRLHRVLTIAMGWTGGTYHAWFFVKLPHHIEKDGALEKIGICYGPVKNAPNDMMHARMHGMDVVDDTKVFVADFLKEVTDGMRYTYDVGDGWAHKIRVVKVTPPSGPTSGTGIEDQAAALAGSSIVSGVGACPPEDAGGPWRYKDQLYAMTSPKVTTNERHEAIARANHSMNYRGAHNFWLDHYDADEARRKLIAYCNPGMRAHRRRITCSCALCSRQTEPMRAGPGSLSAMLPGVRIVSPGGGEYDPSTRHRSNLIKGNCEFKGLNDSGLHCCGFCLDRECPNNPLVFKPCGGCEEKFFCSVQCYELEKCCGGKHKLKKEKERVCRACQTASSSCRRCARCLCVWYCGKDCQRNDWRLRHKKECDLLKQG